MKRTSKQASGVTFTPEPSNRLSHNSVRIGDRLRDPTAPPLQTKPPGSFQRTNLGRDVADAVNEMRDDFERERPNTSRFLGALGTIASGRVSVTREKSGRSRKGKK